MNTGSMRKVPMSASTSSRLAPRAFKVMSASPTPPGCGRALSLRKYCRRRRMRCTFSAILTTWNQAVNARTKSRAAAGARPCTCAASCPPACGSRRGGEWRRRDPVRLGRGAQRRPARAGFRPRAPPGHARPRAVPHAAAERESRCVHNEPAILARSPAGRAPKRAPRITWPRGARSSVRACRGSRAIVGSSPSSSLIVGCQPSSDLALVIGAGAGADQRPAAAGRRSSSVHRRGAGSSPRAPGS